MLAEYIHIGKKIYDMENPREVHRFLVFLIRCFLHPGKMKELHQFFHTNKLLSELAEEYGFVYEQPTRAFFYYKSTFDERIRLMEEHMEFLIKTLREDVVLGLYGSQNYLLWHAENGEEEPLRLRLFFHPGQRKEGLLSLILSLGKIDLYQMIFWIQKNPQGEWALWIGAMQGPNVDHARDLIKKVTKRCYRYRTKDLILYMTQAVARNLGVKHIYAVSNEGYYAMNHVRTNRKLKTNFGAFWEEAGGHQTEDSRFYELPLIEHRKTMEEVPTRKRATYRKRFAFQDDVDTQIAESMKKLMK